MNRVRVLVAEDDPNIREGLRAALESEGYDVETAPDGEGALRAWARRKPPFDLLLLDIMMPGRSGYDVCREVRRADRRVPILFLTAKGEEVDKVVGLELGADDYVTKPFGVRELLARVAAVLRRARAAAEPPAAAAPPPLPDRFRFGDVEVDRLRYTATRGRRTFALTARELKLLETFHRRPDEVLSRDALLNACWGIDYLGTTRTLDQHIAQLRKKIERDVRSPRILLTVHGVGYRYRPEGAGGEVSPT
jgi:DNA-binding response OmpR family regulator